VEDEVCRRLMTISGVGPIVSLAFTATIDIQRLISGNQTLRYFQQSHILLGAPCSR
jgi:Holliday junction resolvasome RuvABC DNA-binding subunit